MMRENPNITGNSEGCVIHSAARSQKRILCNNAGNITGENFLVDKKALGTGDCTQSDKPELLGQIDTLGPAALRHVFAQKENTVRGGEKCVQARFSAASKRAWALIYTQIPAHARTNPLAQAQARLASRKRHSPPKSLGDQAGPVINIFFLWWNNLKNQDVLQLGIFQCDPPPLHSGFSTEMYLIRQSGTLSDGGEEDKP
ncbi:hypothetical protein K438DRAFT_1784423 [Mycena galopus ATCC 62051]|nr:hypothetical protein K438DRAFT_1784423 [Mycena galopus ATCC 62051]